MVRLYRLFSVHILFRTNSRLGQLCQNTLIVGACTTSSGGLFHICTTLFIKYFLNLILNSSQKFSGLVYPLVWHWSPQGDQHSHSVIQYTISMVYTLCSKCFCNISTLWSLNHTVWVISTPTVPNSTPLQCGMQVLIFTVQLCSQLVQLLERSFSTARMYTYQPTNYKLLVSHPGETMKSMWAGGYYYYYLEYYYCTI